MSYAASGLPKGLSINAQSGLISGLPDEPGTYAVTVNVSDPAGHENADEFQLDDHPAVHGNRNGNRGTSTSTSSSTSTTSSTSTVIP